MAYNSGAGANGSAGVSPPVAAAATVTAPGGAAGLVSPAPVPTGATPPGVGKPGRKPRHDDEEQGKLFVGGLR